VQTFLVPTNFHTESVSHTIYLHVSL